jgi:hypothetical protein
MDRAAPPGNDTDASDGARIKTQYLDSRKYRRARVSANQEYLRIIASRYANDLLTPFRCAVCGVIALDPLGRNEKREFLCAGCADGGTEGSDRTLAL